MGVRVGICLEDLSFFVNMDTMSEPVSKKFANKFYLGKTEKPVAPFLFVLFREVVKAQNPFESFVAVISRPLLERHEVWLQTLVVAKRLVQVS